MLRITRSFSVLILAGAMAPVAANAASFTNFLHVHAGVAEATKGQISFTLVNRSEVAKEVTIGGHSYTLAPKQPMTISALPGSKVTEGNSADKVLFTVERIHKGTTVNLN